MFRMIGKAAVVASFLCAGMAGAEAMPAATNPGAGAAMVQAVQYGPSHYHRKYYRREMRRYRGNPGARFELRQNRRVYCRNTPSRC